MTTANAVLGLRAETSIHAGAGRSVGVVDLPIQREGHTGWPCIYGSAVKGALRTLGEEVSPRDVDVLFGPEKPDHAGALLVGDARLLLLPVRSLTSHFKWVTSPAVLRRFQRDRQRMGVTGAGFAIPDPAQGQALVPVTGGQAALFLEEYRFTVDEQGMDDLIGAIVEIYSGDLEAELRQQLCVIQDDWFNHLAQHVTPVAAHVRLTENKTVAPGQLWYEETLPPDSLLYVALAAQPSRDGSRTETATQLLDLALGLFSRRPYLQVGGNETLGMGWCRVTSQRGAAHGQV